MQDSVDNSDQSIPQLISAEARVLGALMEKQLTTPDQYPLTLNSLVSACNQKSSRDPVTRYTQGEVTRTLMELEHRKFVQKEFGSRADKYTQKIISQLALTKKHQALLCVMLLRGPQTLSELNTRTQRMYDFSDKNELQHTLDRLCDREVPFVVRLSQQPGQRGERFAHLFSCTPATAAETAPVKPSEQSTSIASHSSTSHSSNSTSPSEASTRDETETPISEMNLHNEVNRLQAEVTSLQAETAELKQKLMALYELTGNKQSAKEHQ